MGFETIETQEQLDAVIGSRLERERAKYKDYLSPEDVEEKYKGYLSPEDVKAKYEGYLSPEDVKAKYKGYLSPEEAKKKDEQIGRYETDSLKVKIAQQTGIPYELAGRLSGDDEESIKKDAETMARYLKMKSVPLRSTEEPGQGKNAALKKTLNGLKGE